MIEPLSTAPGGDERKLVAVSRHSHTGGSGRGRVDRTGKPICVGFHRWPIIRNQCRPPPALPLQPQLLDIIAVLDRRRGPRNVDLPGLRVHPLKGRLQDHYAVTVSGNWRVAFRFEDGDAVDVDYLDYH